MSALPTNWRAVIASDSEFAACAQLLSGAHAENKTVSPKKLGILLGKTYYEPLAAAGDNKQPLLLLYGYRPAAETTLVVAFHKTIKRSKADVPTGPKATDSTPTRRWWCITAGCKAQPATGWSYPHIRDICLWFYGTMERYELLVLVDDESRLIDPTRCNSKEWEVDAAAGLIAGDTDNVTTFNPTTLATTSVADQQDSYDPFKRTLTVKPDAKLAFLGVEPASL